MRSLLLRTAGAVVSIVTWLAVIVFALNNLDTGLPDTDTTIAWLFLLVALAVTVMVAVYLARNPGSPGWLHFVIGLLIPEVAFVINRLVSTEVSAVFWIAVAVLVLIPLPSSRKVAEPTTAG